MIVLLILMVATVRVPQLMYHVLKGFNFMGQAKFTVDHVLVFQKMESGMHQLKNLDAYQVIKVGVLNTGIGWKKNKLISVTTRVRGHLPVYNLIS